MTKILVAIEDSAYSSAAVALVQRQFHKEDVEVHVLHVIDPMTYLPLYGGGFQNIHRVEELRGEYRAQAQELVERMAKPLSDAGYRLTVAIEEGEPRTSIVDYAEKIQAELIVVGSHGRRGLPRLLLGSVSDYVAHHAPCSVEIVRKAPDAA